MGSFLYNCFASKQTIIEGKDVVIIPILKEQGYHDCELFKNDKKLDHKIPQEYKYTTIESFV